MNSLPYVSDGGPAFPVIFPAGHPVKGMTLRDYFAAAALVCDSTKPLSAEQCANYAYEIADAMLKARKQ